MEDVKDLIISLGMVPVFNHPDQDLACKVVQVCYDAGLRVFEWPNRGAEAARIFPVIMKYISQHCPGMFLGAGSILDGDHCREFHSLGASFIVSPVIDQDMAAACRELNVLWIPGCGTVTEIYLAQKLGAGIVKVFPGDAVGGPGFVRAVLGPMPWSQIMPTGGVSPDQENLKAWFQAGVCCVGMGSQLFTRDRINDPDPEILGNEIRKILRTIKECRKK